MAYYRARRRATGRHRTASLIDRFMDWYRLWRNPVCEHCD